MKFAEIIDEYQIVPDPGFTMPDFTGGQQVGTIQTGAGPLQVWKRAANQEVGYGAIDPAIGPAKPASYLGFQTTSTPTTLIARNALTDPPYQRKGISSELFLFVNKVEGHQILSDTQLTTSGEAIWNSIIRSSKFSVKIAYLPTVEVFELSDIGTATTQDGEPVISPQADSHDATFYNANTRRGQRFFYLIETMDRFSFEEKGKLYEYGIDIARHRLCGGILQPYRYFTNDDP